MRAGALLVVGLLAIPAAPAHPRDLDVAMGKALFERAWIPAPASTDAADGLGPLFNGRACASCHQGAGPARFTVAVDGTITARGIVVRLGDAEGVPDRYYGAQMQDHAVPGLEAEGDVVVHTREPAGSGAPPAWSLALTGPPLAPGVRAGLRQAPSLTGRAGLARIDARAVLVLADPDDRDGDGISGRARLLGNDGKAPQLGRFGWKAAVSGIRAQVASAFALDMGLSSAGAPLSYGDCTAAQTDCRTAPTGVRAAGRGNELADETIHLVATFVESRKTQRTNVDAHGLRLFGFAGCTDCHVPHLSDADGQPIPAFTDLLLHDMGDQLDDGVGEPGVASREWRTAPLIDLDRREGTRRYLHDGRAATIAAAVAAHGGEAAASRARFAALPSDERVALCRFLEGL